MDDRERWEPLWQGYLDFYRSVLTPEVTERTWAALCDPTSAVHGLVAEQEDQLAGFADQVTCGHNSKGGRERSEL